MAIPQRGEATAPFGRSGYVTAVAVGKSQRFYWYYLSFPPRDLGSGIWDLRLLGAYLALLITTLEPPVILTGRYGHNVNRPFPRGAPPITTTMIQAPAPLEAPVAPVAPSAQGEARKRPL
jgi:hypothetical protein